MLTNEERARASGFNAALSLVIERCRWRPVSELHEDFGPCVGTDVRDPGYIVIVHACDIDPDTRVTHFTRFIPLTAGEAASMLKDLEYEARGADNDYERLMTS